MPGAKCAPDSSVTVRSISHINMRRHAGQAALSLGIVLCCAVFAYYAQINGLSDAMIAAGATVISAVLLGYFWRRRNNDPGE